MLEDFGKYFNNKEIKKDDAQEHMSELLHTKEKHLESRHALYEEFETIQSSIDRINSEIDELVTQQNKAGISVTIAEKHGQLTNYERRLEAFVKKYPKMAETEQVVLDRIREKLLEKKDALADLVNIEEENIDSIARQN